MPSLRNAPDDPASSVAPSLSRILRNLGIRPRRGQKPCGFSLATNAIRIWSGTIDLLISLDYDFRAAVTLLERWLNQHQAQLGRKEPGPSHTNPSPQRP